MSERGCELAVQSRQPQQENKAWSWSTEKRKGNSYHWSDGNSHPSLQYAATFQSLQLDWSALASPHAVSMHSLVRIHTAETTETTPVHSQVFMHHYFYYRMAALLYWNSPHIVLSPHPYNLCFTQHLKLCFWPVELLIHVSKLKH